MTLERQSIFSSLVYAELVSDHFKQLLECDCDAPSSLNNEINFLPLLKFYKKKVLEMLIMCFMTSSRSNEVKLI